MAGLIVIPLPGLISYNLGTYVGQEFAQNKMVGPLGFISVISALLINAGLWGFSLSESPSSKEYFINLLLYFCMLPIWFGIFGYGFFYRIFKLTPLQIIATSLIGMATVLLLIFFPRVI